MAYFRTLALASLLLLGAPGAGLWADEPAQPSPPGPKPAPSDPPPTPAPAPTEPPAPGEPPPPDAPKPEDPPAVPTDPEAARRKLEEEEAAKERAEEEERQRRAEAQKTADEDDGVTRPEVPVPARPGPGGMCYVPAGTAIIGSGNEELARVLGSKPESYKALFQYERPRHERAMPDYWMDAGEVTNAQYEVFLREHIVSHVCDGKYPTLVDLAGHLLSTPEHRRAADAVAWRQMAFANRAALAAAMPDVAFPDGFRTAILPKRDLTLVFTKLRPPSDWPGIAPHPARLDHPVRDVSCLDGLAYFEWAGKHMQDEFEYEYAARGPEGWEFPWGKGWKSQLTRCNWGAKHVDPKSFEADTWPVGSEPRGRSWVNVHDLVGNVAEWTASMFGPYPDSKAPRHDYMGYVHVIRGGTAVDQELPVLRPQYRNFQGTVKEPPYCANRYPWVGLRGAWWPKPGANQGPTVAALVYGGGHVKRARLADPDQGVSARPDGLDESRLAGAVAENFVPPGVEAPGGVYVLGRSRVVLVIPRPYVLDNEATGDDLPKVVIAKTKAGMLKESETREPMMLLGAFRTDAKLKSVWTPVRLPPPANEEERKAREKEKEKRRGRSEVPATEAGELVPGTYLLALWHGRLALLDTSRDLKCFLSAAGKAPNLDVKKIEAEQPPACKVVVDDELGTVSVQIAGPVAIGKSTDPLLWYTASFSVEVPVEDLESPNGWR